MTREISPVCNFIFGSICTGLLMDTVDVELTIRTVKGIYMYRKDHMAKSTVFSPWSRTVISFPSLCKKIQAFQNENRQTSAWNKDHAMSYFSTPAQPKCRHTSGKTRTRWSNQRNHFNLIKMEWYNTQDWDTTDFNTINTVKPTPRRLCTRTSKGCTYCTFDAPHPSIAPSDWSSEDWDGNKAKGREQRPHLDFKLLEQQIQKTLQDTTQDVPQDMTHNAVVDKQETDVIDGIQDLTTEPKQDTQNSTDIQAPPLDMPEAKCKEEDRRDDPTTTPTYEMTDQEIWLQHEEEKYGIYMSTFSKKGDNSDLDSEMDSDSNATAYPFLE